MIDDVNARLLRSAEVRDSRTGEVSAGRYSVPQCAVSRRAAAWLWNTSMAQCQHTYRLWVRS